MAGDGRLYVTQLDTHRNQVILGPEEALWGRELAAQDVNWVSGCAPPQGESVSCLAQIRYRTPASPATVVFGSEATASVTFDSPQRAITPGQAVVFYRDSTLLGGGIIQGPAADDRT